MSDAELDEHLQALGRVRSRNEGLIAQAAAEKKRRTPGMAPAAEVLGGLRMSGRAARNTLDQAEHLQRLSATRDALSESRISPEHAKIMTAAHQNGRLDEAKMLQAAEEQTPDEFKKTMNEHQQELDGDDGQARLNRLRRKRTVSFTERDDGMWQLFALFDPQAATRIRRALNHCTDLKWRARSGREHRWMQHQRADALEQLLTRHLDADGHGEPQRATLVLVADYDLVDDRLGNPRLADGTPLPESEFHLLACDVDVLPALFTKAEHQPMWLGAQRHASPALRAAIEARDQGCIGCGKGPEWCVAHHIQEWQHGGPTQPDNLVLVCHSCHDKAHHRNHTVEQHPETGRYYLRPPWQQPPSPPASRPLDPCH